MSIVRKPSHLPHSPVASILPGHAGNGFLTFAVSAHSVNHSTRTRTRGRRAGWQQSEGADRGSEADTFTLEQWKVASAVLAFIPFST